MSQDLLAAFNVEQPPDNHPVSSSKETKDRETSGLSATGIGSIDDDDFGDFEDASCVPVAESASTRQDPSNLLSEVAPTRKQHPVSSSFRPKASEKVNPASSRLRSEQETVGAHPFAGHMDLLFDAGDDEYDAGDDELGDLSTNPEAAMAFSKRLILEQKTSSVSKPGLPKVQRPSSKTARSTAGSSVPKSKGSNVLFDADDVTESDEDEDDFGDFEDGEAVSSSHSNAFQSKAASAHHGTSHVDLLGLDDQPKKPSHTSPLSSQDVNSGSSFRPRAENQEEDTWNDFEPCPPTKTSTSTPHRPKKNSPPASDLLPPTNVPPPVLLLSVFPSLFAAADDALFDSMSKLDLKSRQMLLAHPASHQFLRGYLGHCVVLGRIIAGRKLRWRRDHRLSQSMRIGPAGAGGKGGMKLAGIDKSEATKEDRETVDIVRLFRGQIGKLRTAVTAASAAPGLPRLPHVPDVAENMAVKSLAQSEGGVTAPQPCALCGLKRQERVVKVDAEVDDSFGEWWNSGMSMHVACRKFWEDHESKMKSR